MAKEKKTVEVKKAGKLSKGERYAVDPWVCKQIKKERTPLEREMYRLKAWVSGRTVKGMEDWSRVKWPFSDRKTIITGEPQTHVEVHVDN